MSVVIITGASKGYGRAVTKAFARLTEGDLHLVLSARNMEELASLKVEVEQLRASNAARTTTQLLYTDFAGAQGLHDAAKCLFDNETLASATKMLTFVNNAGSLGPLCNVGSPQLTDTEIVAAVNLNVTSCLYLTSAFVNRVNAIGVAQRPKITVVNVSSLAAVVAFPSWSLYCSGKAARDMFHSVLAEEQKKKRSDPTVEETGEIKVLNWAPGPMDTNMAAQIRASEAADPSLGNFHTEMKEKGTFVDVDVSAEKLVKLVRTPGAYASGAHVDFYDEVPALL